MRRITLAAMLLALLPCVGLAQSVVLRSGEHDDFTRLVFDMPSDLRWRVDRPERRKLAVTFDARGLDLDVSSVFDRINTERISEVTPLPNGDGVSIELACRCSADSFLHQDDMLVIDIRDAIGVVEPLEGDLAETEQARNASTVDLDHEVLSELRLGPDPGIGPRLEQSMLVPRFRANGQSQALAVQNVPLSSQEGDFERMLAEQLARAATDGLLDPAISISLVPDKGVVSEEPPLPVSENRTVTIDAKIASRTSNDRETRVRIGGDVCIPASVLDLASWGDDDTLRKGIPELRGKLFGEFDRLDDEIAVTLAKAYVYLGFGAEARALLDLLPEPPDPGLFALAGIVDGEIDRVGVFAGQSNCEGHAALWALLGSATLPKEAEVNSNAVLRSFEALPLHLRTSLGPRLAIRLAEEGAPDAARSLLGRLSRALGKSDEQMAFSAAQVDKLGGAVGTARQELKRIADGTGSNAANAVADSIEIAVREGERIDPKMGDLAAAYATELRGTDQGSRLWLAQVRALAASGRYDDAFRVLRTDTDHPLDLREQAASDALLIVEDAASETDFLKQVVAGTETFDGIVRPEAALAIARRLLDLKLPDPAERWLSFGGVDPASREARLLRARVHLARSEPEQAEIAIVGLQGEDALRLRARARELMGDYQYATSAYASLGEEQQSEEAAWLAGAWPLLDGRNDPIGRTAAVVETSVPDPGDAPSLSMAEALAGASSEARDTLRKLLDETHLGDE